MSVPESLRRASWTRLLLLLVAAALLIRVAAVIAEPHLPLVADPRDYVRHGLSLAHGDGYPEAVFIPTGGPTAVRPPGFPYVLAGVFALTGDSIIAARILQAILGAGAVALLALIAREFWGPRVALVAAGLTAIFPPLIVVGLPLLSEPLFIVLELGAIFAVLRYRTHPRALTLVSAGVLLGLATLTRQQGLFVLLPLMFAVREGQWRRIGSYKAPLLLAATAVLLVAPWTIRNAVATDAFVPVSDQGGYTLVGTYNETSRDLGGKWISFPRDPELKRYVAQHSSEGEVAVAGRLQAKARRFALDHPSYLFQVAWYNARLLFDFAPWDVVENGQRVGSGLGSKWTALSHYGFFPFLALAIVGLLTGTWRRAPWWFWLAPVLMLSTIMIVAGGRFRAPLEPFLLILAAAGAVAVVDRIRGVRAHALAG